MIHAADIQDDLQCVFRTPEKICDVKIADSEIPAHPQPTACSMITARANLNTLPVQSGH